MICGQITRNERRTMSRARRPDPGCTPPRTRCRRSQCPEDRIGRWPSRDPIQERGGKNLYAFNHNNCQSFADANGDEPIGIVGNPAGRFIVSPTVIPPGNGNKSGNGFTLRYSPGGACSCPKSDITLSRAISHDRGNLYENGFAHFDFDDWKPYDLNKNRVAVPITSDLPSVNNSSLAKGPTPLSYVDRPNSGGLFEPTYTITVCALCIIRGGGQRILGCVTFTWNAGTPLTENQLFNATTPDSNWTSATDHYYNR